jgi:hypothetical protein
VYLTLVELGCVQSDLLLTPTGYAGHQGQGNVGLSHLSERALCVRECVYSICRYY